LHAQADRADPDHTAIADVLRNERRVLVTSQVAVAEADYLILTRLGIGVELAFLDDLAEGTFAADALSPGELATACDVVRRYRDLEVGLADASLVVLAAKHRTRRVCTVEERCFRAMKPLQGGSFELLPADAGTGS
jgi:hypothetical protein